MLVVVAHRSPGERARIAATLRAVDISAQEAGADLAASVRAARPDVVLVDDPAWVGDLASDLDLLGTSIVLIGGDASVEVAQRALDDGAHDVLPDPPNAAQLLARVRSAARATALRGQLLAREERLEELAFNDELTGLWNRRFMARRLSASLHAAERHGHPVSVALVDIDRFKDVNDRHGHAAGDAVLVEVATRLRQAVREEDVVGRWGGEEFLVLLPDEPGDGVLAAADRIRAHVGERAIEASGAEARVTVSVGCATHRRGEALDALLRRADEALYEAKRAGRNAVAS